MAPPRAALFNLIIGGKIMKKLNLGGMTLPEVLALLQECTDDNEHSLRCYWITFYFCPRDLVVEARKIVKYHERLGHLNYCTFLRRNRLMKKAYSHIRNAYGEDLYAKIYATG